MFVVTVQLPDASSVSRQLSDPGRCVVGRARDADLRIPDSEKVMSRHHLVVAAENGQLFVEDLGSSNGTFIGSEKLVPGQKYPLKVDQPVELGASQLTVDVARGLEPTMTRMSPPAYKPEFVGVLYTDIVNSTLMTGRLGPDRATELLEWHNQTFRDRFKRYGGRETKFTGDGFEVVFTTITNALSCAAACQRALLRRNHGDPSGWRLEVRMGVNGGEAPSTKVKNKPKRIYGMPLIIAARVMAVGGAGQVLVPAHVPGIIAGTLFRFNPIGKHDLKGIEQPMELLEFIWQLDPTIQLAPEVEAHEQPAPVPAPVETRPA